jgi:hypothetical protein
MTGLVLIAAGWTVLGLALVAFDRWWTRPTVSDDLRRQVEQARRSDLPADLYPQAHRVPLYTSGGADDSVPPRRWHPCLTVEVEDGLAPVHLPTRAPYLGGAVERPGPSSF